MLLYLALIDSEEGRSTFETLYRTYRDLMLWQAQDILKDWNDTEDVVHESFLKLTKYIDRIDDPKSPKTRALVVTVTERTAIDLYRRRKRLSFCALDEEWAAPSPEIEAIGQQSALAAAMARLPARYREVLLLRFDSGFSAEEVGELLSMSPDNVRKTIQRAKKKLSEALQEQEV